MTRPAYLRGFGMGLPSQEIDNHWFTQHVETSHEWIVERTGIETRRFVGEGQSTSTLATEAAQQAMQAADVPGEQIEAVVVGTASGDRQFPATACLVQDQLGFKHKPMAFDVSAACSGFVYSLMVCQDMVASGRYQNVLTIGAEALSRIVNFKDRNSCVLFGDGAGAAVVSSQGGHEILWSQANADGSMADMITMPMGSVDRPTPENLEAGKQYIYVEGREVYKRVVNLMPDTLKQAADAVNVSPDDFALIVPHQMNRRIIAATADRLGMSMDKFYVNISRYGNTSAASIPLCLTEIQNQKILKPGDLVCLMAFGGGFTWASAVIRWGEC